MFKVHTFLAVILAFFPVFSDQCLRTAAVSSPVVEPSTDPTPTPCSPTSITYGTADGPNAVAVTYSNVVNDDTAMTSSMTVSCTAPIGFAVMDFNLNEGGTNAFTPVESTGFTQTVAVTLTCSYTTQSWVYTFTLGGVSSPRPVTLATCLQIS